VLNILLPRVFLTCVYILFSVAIVDIGVGNFDGSSSGGKML
jgi:hypothetical protein